MEIKRKFKFTVLKSERFIVRKSNASRPADCVLCGEAMLTIEQAANLLCIKQRRIFRIVETGAAHYAETSAGALMICLNSLTAFLDCEFKKK